MATLTFHHPCLPDARPLLLSILHPLSPHSVTLLMLPSTCLPSIAQDGFLHQPQLQPLAESVHTNLSIPGVSQTLDLPQGRCTSASCPLDPYTGNYSSCLSIHSLPVLLCFHCTSLQTQSSVFPPNTCVTHIETVLALGCSDE